MDGWISRCLLSIIFYSGALLPSQTFGIGDTHLCSSPLGMESGEIVDSALSASSYYVKNVGPEQARLNQETQGGAWCPKDPISIGIREWLQISLNGTHLISGAQMQGRYSNGLGQEYTEEFQLEYWREGFQSWRKYYRFDGKTVFPGNTDTSTVVTTKLRPPLFAQKVRFLPYSAHRRVVCLRVELLGCVWQGGVLQYSVEQGDTFSEGISLRDDSYDGQGSKWDRKVEVETASGGDNNNENSVNIFQHRIEPPYSDASNNSLGEPAGGSDAAEDLLDVTRPRELLTGGLGQLTDKIEGANSFTMDVGFGLGNGWVGWRKRKEDKDWVELLFEFDEVRRFSYMDVFSNNYPSKGVQYLSRARVYFSIAGLYYSSRPVAHSTSADVSTEETRNLTIPLEQRIARFLKIQLFYRGPWIVIGELYFHSEIYDGNYTEEMGPDAQVDFPDTQAPLEIGDLDSSMVETVVGIISGLILLLGIVAGLIVCMRRNGRSISSAFQFHSGAFHFPWRTTWSSVPTHIVTQTNPTTEGVKDLLLTLTPLSNGGVGTNGNGGLNHHRGLANNGDHHHHHLLHHPHAALNNTTMLVNGSFKVNNLHGNQPPPSYTNGTAVTMSGVANTGKNSNGLKLQGSHYNNYGTTKKSFVVGVTGSTTESSGKAGTILAGDSSSVLDASGNSSVSSSGGPPQQQQLSHRNPPGSPTKLTLRSNQLAQAFQESEDYQQKHHHLIGGTGGGGTSTGGGGTDAAAAAAATSTQPGSLDDDGVYQDASTLSINSSTLRTRNRKMKVASSVWNLSSGGGRSYRNHRGRLVPEVSLRQLRLIENLGSCVHGQVHLYEFEGEIACPAGTLYRNCRLIAKTIKNLAEIRLLSVLDHEHVLEIIGVCSEMKKPILALYPAPECGDLCSFLSRLSNTPSLSWLLSVGSQIASGMNYLESLSLIHRDLAARNCLVEREGSIRISDLAMACEQYRDDYCHTPGGLAPLRWWSWESILTSDFTMQSSVWSFGVTLWEILTLCRQKPLAHIADHQLTTLAEKYGSLATSQQVWLPQPLLSPPELFDLMRECWQKNPADRPTFQHIHLFLEQKCNTTIYHAV